MPLRTNEKRMTCYSYIDSIVYTFALGGQHGHRARGLPKTVLQNSRQ